jgi:glycosyltransferase involved in cell wall biosynthesis
VAEERLRICVLTTFFPPLHFGGDAVYAYRLAVGLAQRGHEVTVVHSADAYRALGGASLVPTPPDPDIERIVLSRRFYRTAALASYMLGKPALYESELSRVLGGRRFDVVHFQNVSLVGGPAVLQTPEAGVTLYTTHEHWLVCPMHVLFRDNREPCVEPHCLRCTLHHRRPPQLWRYSGLLERSTAAVDVFLAPSRFAIDAHRSRGFPYPMRRLAPFLPTAEVAFDDDPHDGGGRPYFLFVGRLERLKGVQVLIEVFRRFRDADLVVVGDGSHAAALRRQAADLDHVRFLGPVAWSKLGSLYRSARALLIPSVGYETFGIVGVEALARRTPIIVHDLGALPELVEDSRGAGLVYANTAELIDAMERVLADEELRLELGRRGEAAWRQLWSDEPHFAAYHEAIAEARDRVAR